MQDSEEMSDEEEMKIAEMRPPLIEISINQPKVVTLSKDRKGVAVIIMWQIITINKADVI